MQQEAMQARDDEGAEQEGVSRGGAAGVQQCGRRRLSGGQRPHTLGILAGLSLLILAVSHPSLAGLLWLLAFLAWAGVLLSSRGCWAAPPLHARFWRSMATLAGSWMFLLLLAQVAFALRPHRTAAGSWLALLYATLDLLGMFQIHHLILAVCPPLLSVMLCSAGAKAWWDAHTLRIPRPLLPPMVSAAPDGDALAWLLELGPARVGLLRVLAAWHNPAGVACAALLFLAGASRPGLLGAPYLALTCALLLLWSSPGSRLRVRRAHVHLLQAYCALHIMLLYLWQLPLFHPPLPPSAPAELLDQDSLGCLHRLPPVSPGVPRWLLVARQVACWAGLYRVQLDSAPGQGGAPQPLGWELVQAAVLPLLYLSCSLYSIALDPNLVRSPHLQDLQRLLLAARRLRSSRAQQSRTGGRRKRSSRRSSRGSPGRVLRRGTFPQSTVDPAPVRASAAPAAAGSRAAAVPASARSPARRSLSWQPGPEPGLPGGSATVATAWGGGADAVRRRLQAGLSDAGAAAASGPVEELGGRSSFESTASQRGHPDPETPRLTMLQPAAVSEGMHTDASAGEDAGGSEASDAEAAALSDWGLSWTFSLGVAMAGGLSCHVTEMASSSAALAAVLLCVLSLLEPSLMAGGLLLVGQWTLLSPTRLGHAILVRLSPFLAWLLLLWYMTCYLATALLAVLGSSHFPAWAHLVGLYPFQDTPPPFLLLAAFLALAICLCGLARRHALLQAWRRRRSRRSRSAQNRRADLESGPGGPGDLSAPLLRQQEGAEALPEVGEEGEDVSWLLSSFSMPHEGAAAGMKPAAAELYARMVRTAWYLGFGVVPTVLFLAGVLHHVLPLWHAGSHGAVVPEQESHLLHGVYLLILLLQLLAGTVRLAPSHALAELRYPKHYTVRLYASLHLAAVYLAVLGRQDHVRQLQPEQWRAALQLAGLWRPRMVQDVLPVLGVFLTATVHAAIGNWLHGRPASAQDRSTAQAGSSGSATARTPQLPQHAPAVLWLGRSAVAVGVYILSLQGYLLLLAGMPVGVLGLLYLLLLLLVFSFRPRMARPAPSPSAEEEAVPEEGGEAAQGNLAAAGLRALQRRHERNQGRGLELGLRWLPQALLALLAAADLVLQYILTTKELRAWTRLSPSVLHFLDQAVGLGTGTSGRQLLLSLARPISLLMVMRLYRVLYAVGSCQPLQYDASLQGQLSLQALTKRLVVLHAGKAVFLAAAWCALSSPGLLGLAIVLSMVLLASLLFLSPGSRSSPGGSSVPAHGKSLEKAMLTWMAGLGGSYMLLEYAFQVDWIRDHALGGRGSWGFNLLHWCGLKVLPETEPGALEAALRAKVVLLAGVVLQRWSIRWYERLPGLLRSHAVEGSLCCVFWPPPGTRASLQLAGRRGTALDAMSASTSAISSMLLQGANRVMRAVDLKPAAVPEVLAQQRPLDSKAAGDRQASALAGSMPKWRLQLQLMLEASKDFAENLWLSWGVEMGLLALLVTAFLFANAISLLLLALTGLGMLLHPDGRRPVWRWFAVPLLASVVVLQYVLLMVQALQPSSQSHPLLLAAPTKVTWRQWLGLENIQAEALWSLIITYGLNFLLLQLDMRLRLSRRNDAHTQEGLAATSSAGVPGPGPGNGPDSIHEPLLEHLRPDEPLLVRSSSSPNAESTGGQPHASAGLEESGTRAGMEAGGGDVEGAGEDDYENVVWVPMDFGTRKHWSWMHWVTYWCVRHSVDLVLIAVVLLCFVERDVVHAGYLAVALLFFRRRESLWHQRNAQFRYLPIFNFLVMLASLLYQVPPLSAPWTLSQRSLPECLLTDGCGSGSPAPGPGSGSSHSVGCDRAQVIGFHRFDPANPLSALDPSVRGALADVLLWLVLRLQYRIFQSSTFRRVSACVKEELREQSEGIWQRRRSWVEAQAAAALRASRLRWLRGARISALKAAISRARDPLEDLPTAADQPRSPSPATGSPPLLGGAAAAAAAAAATGLRTPSPLPLVTITDPGGGGGGTGGVSDAAAASAVCSGDVWLAPPPTARPTEAPGDVGAWWWAVLVRMTRIEKESILCYCLMVTLLLADFSLLAVVLLLGKLLYALIAESPSRLYWNLTLLSAELLLLAQYFYQIPAGLNCAGLDDDSARTALSQLGLHRSALRCWPLFLLYLATLMHCYNLQRYFQDQLPGREPPSGTLPGMLDLPNMFSIAPPGSATDSRPRRQRRGRSCSPMRWLAAVVSGMWTGCVSFAKNIRLVAFSLRELYRKAASESERAPHWVKIVLEPPPAASGLGSWTGQDAQAYLEKALQGFLSELWELDAEGVCDSLAAANLQDAACPHGLQDRGEATHSHACLESIVAAPPGDSGAAPGGRDARRPQHRRSASASGDLLDTTGSGRAARAPSEAAPRPAPSLSSVGRGAVADAEERSAAAATGRPPSWGLPSSRLLVMAAARKLPELACRRRMQLRLHRVLQEEGLPHRCCTALLEVLSLASEPTNPAPGESLWQQRSIKPAADAAAAAMLARALLAWLRDGGCSPCDADGSATMDPLLVAPSAAAAHSTAAISPFAEGSSGLGSLNIPESMLPSDYPSPGKEPMSAPFSSLPALQSLPLDRPRSAASSMADDSLGHSPGGTPAAAPRAGSGPALSPLLLASPLSPMDAADDGATPRLWAADTAAAAAVGGVLPDDSSCSEEGRDAAAQEMAPMEAPADTQAAALLDAASRIATHDPQHAVVIRAVEHHARAADDLYAATCLVDFLCFLYTTFFFQSVMWRSHSLQEISDERVVPQDYLLALLASFAVMLADRVVYSLGWHLGKLLQHFMHLLLFLPLCIWLYWAPGTGASARTHLRIFLLLKCASFALSARQLRSGYPPPASLGGNGRGRHSFWFYRSSDFPHWLGFQVFCAIPFLYELRALLDWTCTATTLKLQDWMKLEDIRMSLYQRECDLATRVNRRLGSPQPRQDKLTQGALLFVLLLVLLWVPLLLFSAGNPTFRTPHVVSVALNASLSLQSVDVEAAHLLYPILHAGHRRAVKQWTNSSSIVGQMEYSPAQLQLLCLTTDADSVWPVTPPARRMLLDSMLDLDRYKAELLLDWRIVRDGPLPSQHGGPECQVQTSTHLAEAARQQIAGMLQAAPGPPGAHFQYHLMWQVRGDHCDMRLLAESCVKATGPAVPDWECFEVSCKLQLKTDGVLSWWAINCILRDSNDTQLDRPPARRAVAATPLASPPHPRPPQAHAVCPEGMGGPMMVVVLEQVQGGVLGEVLASASIVGLCFTIVFGVGRLLRLSSNKLRLTIPYADLPSTRRLTVLCQDISLARAENELVLEEELYYSLLNIYRLPGVLFEVSRKQKLD